LQKVRKGLIFGDPSKSLRTSFEEKMLKNQGVNRMACQSCRVGNPKNLPLCVLFGIIALVNGIRGIVNVREIRLEGRGKFTLKNMGLEGLTR
jgi:hypothetical protein